MSTNLGNLAGRFSVYLAAFVVVFDTAAIIPILSLYAMELGASKPLIGLIIGVYAPVDIILNLVSGVLSDRIGRKKVFMVGMFIDAIAMFLYSVCKTPIQLLLVRILHGCGSGLNMPSLMTIASEVVPKKRVSSGLSVLGLVFALSFLIGIKSGGRISHAFGYSFLFRLISAIILIMAIVSIFLIPETHYRGRERLPLKSSSLKEIYKMLAMPFFIAVYIAVFARQFVRSVITTLFPIYISEFLGISVREARRVSGNLMSAPLYTYIVLILFAGIFADKKSRSLASILGLLLLSLTLLLIPAFKSEEFLFYVMLLQGIGDALLFPSLTGFVALASSDNQRGRGFGLYSGIETIASAIGGPISGCLAAFLGTSDAIRVFSIIPLISAILIIYPYYRGELGRDKYN